VLLVAAILMTLGFRDEVVMLGAVSPIVAMVFTAATAVLLIADLKRPDRFYFLLTKPNPGSWVVLGTYFLMAYGAIALVWFVAAMMLDLPPPIVVWIAGLLAICAAGYTGFLFAQARGRDLWQSPLFTWHLLVQAAIAGAAGLLIVGAFMTPGAETVRALTNTLTIALVLSAAMILGEIYLAPVSEDVHRAATLLTRGALAARFWGGALLLGVAMPIVLVAIAARTDSPRELDTLAALAAIAGLWFFESVWVEAGQSVALS
jgi:formate-dependent nitrite reductase membrane component NrfD